MAMTRRRRPVAATRLAEVLDAQLAELVPGEQRPLDVVDLGGGTGGLALDVARRGHHVTVVDPSPDALASLERRLADDHLEGTVAARQGDASDLVALLGRSGSGKSTLLRTLGGLDPVTHGTAEVAGTVAVAFQEPRLLPWRRVADNVALALRTGSRPSRRERARRTLQRAR